MVGPRTVSFCNAILFGQTDSTGQPPRASLLVFYYLKLPNGHTLSGHSHDYKRNGTSTPFAASQCGQWRDHGAPQPLIGMPICHGCHRAEPDMIDASWASGCERHYCRQCWPHYYQNYFAVRFAQSDNDERAAKAADNDAAAQRDSWPMGNTKAAKALGHTFPLALLGRADEVIE